VGGRRTQPVQSCADDMRAKFVTSADDPPPRPYRQERGHHSLQRAPMMTAVIAGSEPLATLLCNSAERSIVNDLRETARRCRDRGLHVRLYVFDELADQREALLTPVRAIIWDGHSNGDDDEPGVDGSPLAGIFGRDRRHLKALIVGCCRGAGSKFTDVIRGYLAAPTA